MTDGMNSTMTRRKALLSLTAIAEVAGIFAGASGAEASAVPAGRISLRYFGTAAWEISDGSTLILIDPYVSRIIGPPPPGVPPYRSAAGDARAVYGWDDLATPDDQAISLHIPRADYIMVTHTHYDHILDVPQIALNTGATVIGTESTENVLRAYGVPEKQLITVRGGEDFDFDTLSVRVIPSIHSALDHKHYFSSAIAPAGLKGPLTLKQMHPEGGTLAYLVRFHGHQILAFGSMNYIERELDGLEPDILIAGAGVSRHEIYRYTDRLLHSVNHPPIVLPTHWDNFLAPYGASQQPSIDALKSFVTEVRAASPASKVIIPKYFSMLTV